MDKKYKFLFVSYESESGDLAWRLEKEGHAVKIFIEYPGDKDVYEGVLDKVDFWKDWVEWADIVIFDDIDYGKEADVLRKKGKYVIGGSEYTDKLEVDREFGQAELKRQGVNTLQSWHFSDCDSAVDFINENPTRYVFKPSGGVISADKDLIFIGEEENGQDLAEMLSQNKDIWQKKAHQYLLQRFVPGVEVAVGAFFNGKEFIEPVNINFEYKRLFPGDLGPFTGDMGSLMFWSRPNRLFRETLQKMLGLFQQSGYVGYIDLNCIVNGKGVYPLEFTSRFGYPTLQVQLEGITEPLGEFFYKLASGASFQLKTKKGFQMGAEIYVPSYFAKLKIKETIEIYRDLPIFFKKLELPGGVHIQDVKLIDGQWRIAGESGVVMAVTGSGITVEDARKQAYSRIQNITIQNMFYRTDIGANWQMDSDKLHTWGYLE